MKLRIFLLIILFLIPSHSLTQADGALFSSENKELREYQKTSSKSAFSTSGIEAPPSRNIIVKLKPGMALNTNEAKGKITTFPYLQKENIAMITVAEDENYEKVLKSLKENRKVEYADQDIIRKASAAPTDPLFSQQWHHEMISSSQAWDITSGSQEIVVAVLDSGVNPNHPDLKENLLPGYDFVHNDSLPEDENGHGTLVSGVIGAAINETGIVGVSPHVKILPVKVADELGNFSVSSIISGIYYAIEQGADVINMSYGGYDYVQVEYDALWDAFEKDIILIGAAGNDSSNKLSFPASYPSVISVSATDQNNRKSAFSNYGNWVDISAPGTNIFSSAYDGNYESAEGTSFSAPIVSGVAALLRSKYPDKNNMEIQWLLESSAKQPLTSSIWNRNVGYGIVDAFQSLTKVPISNEKTDEALPLANGVIKLAQLELPLDTDWYTFNVPAKANVQINFQTKDPYLDLIGSLRKEGNEEDDYTFLDKGGQGQNEDHVIELGPGKYHLAIYDYYSRWGSNQYNVSMELTLIQPFPDVYSHIEEISYLSSHGVINGFPDGNFRPGAKLTRAQAVIMIMNQLGIDVSSYNSKYAFKDIHPSIQGYGAILKAREMNIIDGKEGNYFDPNGFITRAEMAKIFSEAYSLTTEKAASFKDVPASYWAAPYIESLVYHGITEGYPDGTYRPFNHLTRLEFSLFMARYLNPDFKNRTPLLH